MARATKTVARAAAALSVAAWICLGWDGGRQGVSRIGAIESLSDRMDLPSPLSWVPDWRGGPHQAQWASSP
jgi:hypothetical protein